MTNAKQPSSWVILMINESIVLNHVNSLATCLDIFGLRSCVVCGQMQDVYRTTIRILT